MFEKGEIVIVDINKSVFIAEVNDDNSKNEMMVTFIQSSEPTLIPREFVHEFEEEYLNKHYKTDFALEDEFEHNVMIYTIIGYSARIGAYLMMDESQQVVYVKGFDLKNKKDWEEI